MRYGLLFLAKEPRYPRKRKMANDSMTVKVIPNDKGNPPGKLAEAELHFTGDRWTVSN